MESCPKNKNVRRIQIDSDLGGIFFHPYLGKIPILTSGGHRCGEQEMGPFPIWVFPWMVAPSKHSKMIVFWRKTPCLLGTTILGNPHIDSDISPVPSEDVFFCTPKKSIVDGVPHKVFGRVGVSSLVTVATLGSRKNFFAILSAKQPTLQPTPICNQHYLT